MATIIYTGSKANAIPGDFSGIVKEVSTFHSSRDTEYYPSGTRFLRIYLEDGTAYLAAAKRFQGTRCNGQIIDNAEFDENILIGNLVTSSYGKIRIRKP